MLVHNSALPSRGCPLKAALLHFLLAEGEQVPLLTAFSHAAIDALGFDNEASLDYLRPGASWPRDAKAPGSVEPGRATESTRTPRPAEEEGQYATDPGMGCPLRSILVRAKGLQRSEGLPVDGHGGSEHASHSRR